MPGLRRVRLQADPQAPDILLDLLVPYVSMGSFRPSVFGYLILAARLSRTLKQQRNDIELFPRKPRLDVGDQEIKLESNRRCHGD